jgi:Na+-transporting methylmalonyl-CoA/oxaloacetate decarboxylase gamma subunit
MNTASIAITVLIGLIVVLAFLFWLIKHFRSMTPKERKLYEQGFNDALASKALDEKELKDKIINVIRNED